MKKEGGDNQIYLGREEISCNNVKINLFYFWGKYKVFRSQKIMSEKRIGKVKVVKRGRTLSVPFRSLSPSPNLLLNKSLVDLNGKQYRELKHYFV